MVSQLSSFSCSIVGMLNDNRKIDYRNRFSFSFSCLYYQFSKWVGYVRIGRSKHGAVACLELLLIELKPLTSVHTSQLAVLRCVRWPGRRLACPLGLLGGRCDCRSFAGQDSVPPPTADEWRHYQSTEDAVHAVTCASLHPCSFVFSCN